ncbi:hypothetical protein HW561_07860 [Rhodobacteraceae bacterium B1Z28]|uniref:Uncharacterized protein n=1 Tax=Ruegeria haliotis TaxID=2747601 RepID=A0ABX2PQL4_9RHOB|nr:hypothetical protein [Ruegeria haliotis]NVO55701.1 hypothetical protein [Ruegeria haliotis]
MKYLSTIALAAFFANGAIAETVTYNCKMTKQDSHGWIAKEYAFQVDADTGKAKATSSFQDWTDGKLKNRGAKGYRIIWSRTERMSAGGDARVRYQANLNPDKNTVAVRMAFVHGSFTNKPSGVGMCHAAK